MRIPNPNSEFDSRLRSALGVDRDVLPAEDVEKALVRDAQRGNDGEREERQRHHGLDRIANAEGSRATR